MITLQNICLLITEISEEALTMINSYVTDHKLHPYLGLSEQFHRPRTILFENETYEIYLIELSDIILFPNESVPLRITNSYAIDYILRMNQYNHIGVVYSNSASSIGTTIEIRNQTIKYDDNNRTTELVILAVARNRFSILSRQRINNLLIAQVLILTDRLPTDYPFNQHTQPFPNWVYNFCKPHFLAELAFALYNDLYPEKITKHKDKLLNPVLFSYFISANLPLNNTSRLQLLNCSNAIDRLRSVILHLQKLTADRRVLKCNSCSYSLSKSNSVFTFNGTEGVVGAYVNTHGSVHQVITVTSLLPNASVILHGKSSGLDSWFPGYNWTIASCSVCGNHLGWLYTSNRRNNENRNNSNQNVTTRQDTNQDDNGVQTNSFENSFVDSDAEEVLSSNESDSSDTSDVVTHFRLFTESSEITSSPLSNNLTNFWGFRRAAISTL